MTTHELINLQFDRAVEIVQGLPKTGPIQTDYEEKLKMYSLYKQATVGNAKPPRPGFPNVLGQAKWNAWAKHKDLDPYEAKWLYVEILLKVLRRYSDKTIAQNLVQELESYGGDPSNLVLSRTYMQSPGSTSSGSTTSHDVPHSIPQSQPPRHITRNSGTNLDEANTSSDEETGDDETHELRAVQSTNIIPRRPHSSQSTHQYQTPITGSFPSQTGAVPTTQPLPTFETPSAFPAPPSTPGSIYGSSLSAPPSSATAAGVNTSKYPNYTPFNDASRGGGLHHLHPHSQSIPLSLHGGPVRLASRTVLERAIENVQVRLAALTERLETLESRSMHHSSSGSFRGSPSHGASYSEVDPARVGGGGGSNRLLGRRTISPHRSYWELDDLGMWSYVLNPLSHAISFMHRLARFLASDEDRSPVRVIVRRLCLDLSFLMCVVMVIRMLWRRSGVRRREVKVALVVLWNAILGTRTPPRTLQDRGV